MDGSWATRVPAASNALPPSTAAGASTRLTARGLAGRLFAALRQGVRRQTPVAAEPVEADETCRTSTQIDLEADLQPSEEQRESRQVNSAKEDEELELLLADIAAQTALLQQEMRQGGLRKCEAEVQISHTELQKQKIARELLEEQLKTLECQLLDSTAEKEEIRSLLKDLAAQTSACAKAQEQVQKALKDMEELGAANGAVKVDEGMESTIQLQDMLVELQPSNDAVKALLKTSCDHLHRQRVEREILEAKLRSMECQLSDATKQDELKTLLRNFALYTAVNLKAEAAIQAVLNDLEALKASKDLEVAIAYFMGDAKAAVAAEAEEAPKGAFADATNSGEAQAAAKDALLERIELHEAMLNCESSKALGDCQRVPDSGAAPPESAGQARYDLQKQRDFAQFLKDADIRLIRAKYLNDLARSKRPLPRRQEAESEGFVFDGKAESALVRHDEVQNWAEGARTATICSVSHAWETKEHPDPCRYQLELVAHRAAWYEAAFETEMWIFYDFTSLFQFERLLPEEERSFRAAMDDMHVMYSHECTMTFRIETLTPESVWESTKENDQELIPVWDANSKRMESKPLKSLEENRTPYLHRGWCIGEISWSSLRYHNAQDQRIDCLGSDQVEPGQGQMGQGLTGKVPLTPDRFQEVVKHAKFTHRDNDLPLVIRLQEKIFQEKVAKCEHLVLKGLPAEEIRALARALPRYRSLTTLKLDTFECDEEAAKAFGEALAVSQVVSLELKNPRPQSGAFMGKAVIDALTTNQSLTSISAEDKSIFDVAAKKALAKALRRNKSIKDRLPLDAPVRLKVVADALERNSLGTSVTVDPAEDQIDDQKAKAVAQLLKSGSPVKSIDLGNTCISDDGVQALAEALRCNQTLEVLCLQEDQITDVGAKALAEALSVNKTLRSLTLDGFYEALRTVEEMKRGRGDDVRFISREEDKKEAEGCRGDILEAARYGKVGVVRHLLRTNPGSVRQTGFWGDTPLHEAAGNGCAEVVELLLAANAPVDVKNHWRDTPLHQAAENGSAEVVELLLVANAPVDVQNKKGWTPLHMAAAWGRVEVVKLLVELASLAVQNEEGDTPLHNAARNGKTEVVELLLVANAPVDVQNKKGRTPLHLAAAWGSVEVVKLLVEVAALGVQDEDGRTPLHLAAAWGNVEVVKLLVEVASLAVQNEDGDTPLHDAARNGRAEVLELLLAANGPVDVQNNGGKTPLDVAREEGKADVVQLLEAAQAVAPAE